MKCLEYLGYITLHSNSIFNVKNLLNISDIFFHMKTFFVIDIFAMFSKIMSKFRQTLCKSVKVNWTKSFSGNFSLRKDLLPVAHCPQNSTICWSKLVYIVSLILGIFWCWSQISCGWKCGLCPLLHRIYLRISILPNFVFDF